MLFNSSRDPYFAAPSLGSVYNKKSGLVYWVYGYCQIMPHKLKKCDATYLMKKVRRHVNWKSDAPQK